MANRKAHHLMPLCRQATVQTGPEAQGIESLPEVKWPERGADHPPPFSTGLLNGLELYLRPPLCLLNMSWGDSYFYTYISQVLFSLQSWRVMIVRRYYHQLTRSAVRPAPCFYLTTLLKVGHSLVTTSPSILCLTDRKQRWKQTNGISNFYVTHNVPCRIFGSYTHSVRCMQGSQLLMVQLFLAKT
jgi:hypothetical protein